MTTLERATVLMAFDKLLNAIEELSGIVRYHKYSQDCFYTMTLLKQAEKNGNWVAKALLPKIENLEFEKILFENKPDKTDHVKLPGNLK